MKICQECCQIKTKEMLCACNGGEIGVKRVGLVDGCVIYSNGIRCKKECSENLVCKAHHKINKDTDDGFLEKLFGK